LRERFNRTRIGRTALSLAAAAGLIGGVVAVEAVPAHADTNLEYTVDPAAAAGGVFARTGPHVNDTQRISGNGIYPGDVVKLICGVTDGDPVGPYDNTAWHYLTDLSRPSEGNFWENDHYLKTPNKASQLTSGEAECSNQQPQESDANKLQPAETLRTFVNYNRDAAKNWALEHARQKPPDAGSCTVFISNGLKAGGFPEDTIWNFDFVGVNRSGLRFGTDATRVTSDFYAYVNTLQYVDIIPIPRFDAGTNNLPQAKIGDVIIYDWDGPGKNGAPDHADLVVGFAKDNPQYPLVSGWSEKGDEAVDYQYRGWTWSEKNNQWLQSEPDNTNMRAWLIHIRTEDDL
jgi:hypothetical protein